MPALTSVSLREMVFSDHYQIEHTQPSNDSCLKKQLSGGLFHKPVKGDFHYFLEFG